MWLGVASRGKGGSPSEVICCFFGVANNNLTFRFCYTHIPNIPSFVLIICGFFSSLLLSSHYSLFSSTLSSCIYILICPTYLLYITLLWTTGPFPGPTFIPGLSPPLYLPSIRVSRSSESTASAVPPQTIQPRIR